MLVSLIAIFSGCFPSIYGVYKRKSLSLNLYIAIIGPAGAGKSVAQWGRFIVKNIEDAYLSKKKMLFFPADTSFAALIEKLNENEAKGILFAFEIDTLAQNFSKEWGNTSSLLRQAYENETYENIRKGDRGKATILSNPELSMLLTGTEAQLISLIPSTEDGLFSRFCFYIVELDPSWIDPFSVEQSFNHSLEQYCQTALRIYEKYRQNDNYQIQFGLTAEQKNHHKRIFTKYSTKYLEKGDAIAIVRRQGSVVFKIAGILSVLRETPIEDSKIICTDNDFNTALILSNLFIENSVLISGELPERRRISLPEKRRTFLEALPVEFNRETADKTGLNLGMNKKLVEKYLKVLQPNYIVHVDHNKYRKVRNR
jgi:hypothetical protein